MRFSFADFGLEVLGLSRLFDCEALQGGGGREGGVRAELV